MSALSIFRPAKPEEPATLSAEALLGAATTGPTLRPRPAGSRWESKPRRLNASWPCSAIPSLDSSFRGMRRPAAGAVPTNRPWKSRPPPARCV